MPDQLQPSDQDQSFQVGSSRVRVRVRSPQGTRLQMTVESLKDKPAAQSIGKRPRWADVLTGSAAVIQRIHWDKTLFWLALALYLFTRLIRLADYPIYFFTDEAVQTVLAEDFVDKGGRGGDQVLLPTYFLNSYQYNLGTSVYLQVLPYLAFGKSIEVTRGVSALATLLAAVCVGLTLRNIFHSKFAWVAVLLLSITPAWFLHSRTAFETSLATSLYAAMVYFYLRYRTANPPALYPAVILGALCFYSYSPIRMVVGLTALFFFFSDLKYHLRNWRTVLPCFGLALVCGLPLLRFQLEHPTESLQHLRVLNSYWIQNIPLSAKLDRYAGEYLGGLNPLYWYISNSHDLARHKMDGYGHIFLATAPLLAVGLGIIAARFRSAAHRALLFCLLAAPSGAALVALGITRSLVMVVPVALISALGLVTVLEWLERSKKVRHLVLALPLFVLLAGVNVAMLADALTNGPLWHQDYGLGGMQYGARQLFSTIDDYLQENLGADLLVSPSWSNGTDTVARFFYKGDLPFQMGSVEGYFFERKPIEDVTFVMIPEEYRRVLQTDKFTAVQVLQTLPYPNGEPGFYFIRMRYVDDIDQILAAEKAARRVLQIADVAVAGQPARVRYSYLDMGSITNIFDGDQNTLIRTLEANPLKVQVAFAAPRPLSALDVRVGGTPTRVTVELLDAAGRTLLQTSQEVPGDPNPRPVRFEFDPTLQVAGIRIEVNSVNDGEPAHVHLWEVTLQP